MMLCECGNANDLKFHHDGSCMECGATPVASPGSLLGDLLSACRELLDQWDKEENKQLAKNSGYSVGLGTGYGICREELRQVIESK